MSIIEIRDLTFTYPGASEPTLKDASEKKKKGDFLAIVGNNGCGKSTLCKTLNGLIPHFIVGDMDGEVLIDGMNTKEQEIGTLARKVGYVYQDFENQIVCPIVLEDASYACLNYAMPDYEEKGKKALNVCGLSSKVDDYVWQLSGGQKHLLALAGTAALSPDILILDEPIAQLDPAHADGIYEVLKELNEKYGKTVIVIEHHTDYIVKYCKNVMLLKDGTVQWILPAKEAMRQTEELQECNIFPPQVSIAAKRMLDEVGADNLMVCANTSIPGYVGETLETYFEVFGNRIGLVQMADAVEDCDQLAWGEGNVNLKEQMDILEKFGYEGPVTMELLMEEYAEDPHKIHADSLEYMKKNS